MNLSGHHIRRATAADLPAIERLFGQDPDYFPRVEGAPMRPDEARQQLVERPPAVPAERKHVYLVDDLALLDVLDGFPDAATWYLGLIFVVPAARGHGLGTRLIEALWDHVRAHGGRALRLAVGHTNPGARRLYDRLGFAFVATRPRTAWTGTVVEVDVLKRAHRD